MKQVLRDEGFYWIRLLKRRIEVQKGLGPKLALAEFVADGRFDLRIGDVDEAFYVLTVIANNGSMGVENVHLEKRREILTGHLPYGDSIAGTGDALTLLSLRRDFGLIFAERANETGD